MLHPQAKQISKKIVMLMIGMLLAIGTLTIRLMYLQIICADYFELQSSQNFLRIEPIPASRGTIVDRNNVPLAINQQLFSVYWQGTGNKQLQKEYHKKVDTLLKIFPSLKDNTTLLKQIKRAELTGTRCLISPNIQFDQLCQLKEQLAYASEISVQSHEKRLYPYDTQATHIIGYLAKRDDSLQPQTGIEKLCNDLLQGSPGMRLKTINSVGSVVSEQLIQEPVAGTTVQTTIDISLQKIGYLTFPDCYKGSLLIMDPQTGAIRALISKPTFSPHLFLDPISCENWQSLQHNNPFLNRAVNAYPPGSIFKLISVSTALEHELIKEDDTWTCHGYSKFANRKYWCHKHSGHGTLDTTHAVGHSCNILFFEVAKRMNIDILAEYAHLFGLGSKTGFLLPEKEGLVPTKAWKREVKDEPWWPGETLSAAIGQSYLLATPLQVARMIGSIFTGSLTRPRILESEPIETKPLMIKEETKDFLKRSMKAVITHGTGKRMNTLKDMQIYAKTSTAQISALGKHILNRALLEHGWFVTHFQYKEHEPLVMVVLVENVGTSRVPAKIARDFLIAYTKYMDH